MGVPVQKGGASRKRRHILRPKQVAVRAEQQARLGLWSGLSICAHRRYRVHHDRVVGHAWEIEHHLVDLAVAIAAHGNDAVGQRVQHGEHLLRCVIAREVVSRTMIEKVTQKNDGVGRFSFDSRHERAAPVRRAVDVGCNQKFHRDAPFLFLRKHTLSEMQVVARLTPARPISRQQAFG